MSRFEAVMFDWMLTLAHYPTRADHFRLALESLERPADDDAIAEMVKARTAAEALPEVQAAEAVEDTSADAHHYAEHLLYARSGFDDELAHALYRLLGTPSFHPCYPDAPPVIEALGRRGARLGVISDIHVDLRAHGDAFGFGSRIETWALSFELGVQKPDPTIFAQALSELDVDPARTLMVGDRAERDGAAAALGMTCLILPTPDRSRPATPRGLDAVLDLVGGSDA